MFELPSWKSQVLGLLMPLTNRSDSGASVLDRLQVKCLNLEPSFHWDGLSAGDLWQYGSLARKLAVRKLAYDGCSWDRGI